MTTSRIPSALRHLCTDGAPLWPLTSMRIGGPARWLAEPHTEGELEAIVAWAQTHDIPLATLGAGTNVLFADDGFPGIVIQTHHLDSVEINGNIVTAQCGANLAELSRHLNGIGLSGLEWACGIPGTIGGAVVMNAGAQGGDIASVLSSVRMLTPEGVKKLPAEQLKLGYRTSALLAGTLEGIVLSATFSLREDAPEHCLSRGREILATRRQTQPAGASSGCIFKNPEVGPTAGELLDRAGCKGMRVGRAVVSTKHANFIINEGKNNASDVVTLIEQMRAEVRNLSGVTLDLEAIIA
ncbi:UDP-N-acetylmuramate dehydrogenase [Candidatus Bipolaricaulota bacterium]